MRDGRYAALAFLGAAALWLFAVAGTEKALLYKMLAFTAALPGTITAVGGGVLRDIFLARAPGLLEADIYATAALADSAVMIIAGKLGLSVRWAAVSGGVVFQVRHRRQSLLVRSLSSEPHQTSESLHQKTAWKDNANTPRSFANIAINPHVNKFLCYQRVRSAQTFFKNPILVCAKNLSSAQCAPPRTLTYPSREIIRQALLKPPSQPPLQMPKPIEN